MSDKYDNSPTQVYRYIDRFSAEYPKRLHDIKNAPAGIYVKGNLPDETQKTVAIVGSRICSQYGRLAAEKFGQVLAQNGVQIISGLARGIDCIAQKAACDAGGASFGVLGCGINIVYPAQNKKIYSQVEKNGGLISEVAPDAAPLRQHFASRNRIISALSDIVLVIEAKEKSGTKITVNHALEQGKDIYALPGRITDLCSEGCNQLISQGAGIATSPDAILNALGIYPASALEKAFQTNEVPLERLEKTVYMALDFYPKYIVTLSKDLSLPLPELTNILFHLQMKQLVKEEGHNYYIRTH